MGLMINQILQVKAISDRSEKKICLSMQFIHIQLEIDMYK